MKTIAILGCGSIGRSIAEQAENVSFVAVFDQDAKRCDAVASLCSAAARESSNATMALDSASSPDNPRTSYLAALSVLALIDNENRHIRVGT